MQIQIHMKECYFLVLCTLLVFRFPSQANQVLINVYCLPQHSLATAETTAIAPVHALIRQGSLPYHCLSQTHHYSKIIVWLWES